MARTSATELPLKLPTLVEVCRHRAAEQPDRRTFVFLENGVEESESLTLGELDARARAIAVRLRRTAPAGARAVLSYPPGLDFVSAFFGCLYAGLIAVPAPPVGRARNDARYSRLAAIADSCRPEFFLSSGDALDRAGSLLADTPALRQVEPVATDEIGTHGATRWVRPEVGPDTVAYLQYTSGTTRLPRGVILTHGSVLHNLALILANGSRTGQDLKAPPPMISWLPVFHDMGLISGVVQPVFLGFDSVLMPSKAFVQHPYSWLRAISDRGEANSAGSSFGYELCAQRVPEQQRRGLDLSGWELALIGAEPVRPGTIDRFSAAFGPCGFRREAFFPSYGMAESTVMVSGGPAEWEPVIRRFDAGALAKGKVQLAGADSRTATRRLVGCGQLQPSLAAAVVDPATGEPCAADEVGEILISGPSLGTGYWNASEETARNFRARVHGHGEREFLRTGDLGFLHDDQVFITGRVQDLIVLDGMQHYPHELEVSAWRSHPAVRDGFGCAFAVGDGQRQRLVVVAEIAPRLRLLAEPPAQPGGESEPADQREIWAGEVTRAIRAAVAAEHGVHVHDVVLVKMGTLPFTTSAKLQRAECRSRYQAGILRAIPAPVAAATSTVIP